MTPPQARREGETRGARLAILEAEARYARDRYRLYRANVSGRRPTSPGRLRELERAHRRADSRLRRARSGEADLLAALNARGDRVFGHPTGIQPRREEEVPQTVTADQVGEAARDLAQEEFTRGDLAEKLGVEKADIRPAFKEARHAGRLEKVRDDEQNTAHFRLTDQ
jgi:hypothetical protein